MKYLFLLTFIFLPFVTFSQSAFEETLNITITPQIPAPGELVKATVRTSFFSNLQKSNITWTVDGRVQKSGFGETTFEFRAPKAGERSTITASVEGLPGQTLTSNLSITPSDLDLVYEANTYTPPFYRGRSIFTANSTVTVAAIANLVEGQTTLPKSRIIYTWEKDGERLPDQSGVGRDSIQLNTSIVPRSFYVTVTAESLNSNLKAKKRILIRPSDPTVVLYENNPIYGSVFEKALTGSFNFDREEVSITAIPYFFNISDRDSSQIKYSWFENGRSIGNETFGSFINYLNPGKQKSGTSNLSVRVDHLTSVLQSGNSSFRINVLGQQQFDTITNNENTAF